MVKFIIFKECSEYKLQEEVDLFLKKNEVNKILDVKFLTLKDRDNDNCFSLTIFYE